MMENRNLSITDIAYMTGFNDVNYFTKVFKKYKGMTPSAYENNYSPRAEGWRVRFLVPFPNYL